MEKTKMETYVGTSSNLLERMVEGEAREEGLEQIGTMIDSDKDEEVIISRHAYTRMKERNGWNRKAADRMAKRVYLEGLRPEQVKGYLKRWINKKFDYCNEGDEYVLYGEMLYIFNGRTMLTVLPTPTRGYLLKEA